jgi:hypothetical protein
MSIVPVIYSHPNVEIIRWDQKIIDFNTYNDYLKKHNKKDIWTAFIDEDEFINTEGVEIHKVMAKFKHYDSIGINWRVFSDRIDEDTDCDNKTLKEKYRYHAPLSCEISRHIKTFCKNIVVNRFTHPHFPSFKPNRINMSIKGERIANAFCNPSHDTIWLDHYHLRGYDEYIKRQTRWIHILGERSADFAIESYNRHKSICTEKI